MPKDQHTDSITDVCYAENARMFVTGSRDGNVKGKRRKQLFRFPINSIQFGTACPIDALKHSQEPMMGHQFAVPNSLGTGRSSQFLFKKWNSIFLFLNLKNYILNQWRSQKKISGRGMEKESQERPHYGEWGGGRGGIPGGPLYIKKFWVL